jgi:hypothetical protein
MNRYSFVPVAVWVLSALMPAVAQVEDLPLPLPQALPPSLPSVPSPPPALDAQVRPVPGVVSKPSASAPLSSTSSSGQFIVYGPDLRVRSGIASKCEEISQELAGLLRTPDPWVLTIVVQIKPLTPTDPRDLGITTQVSALSHGGFHLQLNVPERSGLRPADFRRELIRLLLSERILRTHKRLANEERARLVPPWVHTGVLKALDYRLRGRPSAEFAAIFKSGKIYGIEEILEAVPTGLDGLSRTIYETSCCALMLAVIDQPEGPLRFSRFLAALAQEDKPQRDLLKQWFPGLAESDTSLNKWWSLQLASLASPSMSETLDPTQTAELLDRALTFLVPVVPDQKLPEPTVVASITSQRPAALPEPSQVEAEKTSLVETASPKTAPAPTKKASGSSQASKPATKSVSSRPKDIPAAPAVAATVTDSDTEEDKDKSKRGFLRNLLPFNLGGSDKMEEEAAPETADKKATQSEPEPEAKPTKEQLAAAKAREKELKKVQDQEAKEKAALERAEREKAEKEKAAQEKAEKEQQAMAAAEAKKADQPPPAEPEPKTKTAPVKETAKAAEEPTAEEKSRMPSLNPFKWFRGGKDKSKEEAPKEETQKDGPEEASVPVLDDDEHTAAYAWSPPTTVRGESRVVRDLLGISRGRFIQAPVKPGSVAAPELPAAAAPPPVVMREQADLLTLPEPPQPPTAPLVMSGTTISFPIEDYAVVLAHPNKEQLLAQARLSLQSLAIRGNALFREIASEYQKVIADLSAGKTKDMDTRLKALRKRAVDTYVQACAVQEHLDWFEATQSTRYSGLFEDFLTLPERVRDELPPRQDPISKYLDEVETQLGR